MQLDAWFSMAVFTLATVAFYFMGAAVLNGQLARNQISDADLKGAGIIRTLAHMYVHVLGGWARPFFLMGAWAVLFKTLYVATAANSRLTADFLNLVGVWHPTGPAARERMIKVFCVVYPVLALGLYYAFREPQGLIKAGGIAQALMLPLIAGATLYLRGRDTDRRVGPTFLTDVFTWLAFFGITAVAAYSVYGQIRDIQAWAFEFMG